MWRYPSIALRVCSMKVQIQIRGRRYTVRSDENDGDIQAIASYVDAKMASVAKPSMDEYTVAMLAAMNIASEFDRFRRRVDADLADLDRELATTGVLLDAAVPLAAEE
jgi:cell division protein ZapA (FtsZ GTPase activity inhibitor)